MCQVRIHGELREYPEGTPFGVIAQEYQSQYKDPIVLVMADGRRL